MIEEVSTLPEKGILDMLFGSGPVVQAVLVILILLSVWSWTITIAKILQFRRARRDSSAFSEIFWESKNFTRVEDSSRRLSASPLAALFLSGYRELVRIARDAGASRTPRNVHNEDIGLIQNVLKRVSFEELLKLERGITFLASVASAAPFIGLFGTVWGIMNAFHGLSSAKSTTIQAVAPGISEALVATAIGLAAAIPAAVAYNYFTVTLRYFRELMEKFSEEFVSLARRELQQ